MRKHVLAAVAVAAALALPTTALAASAVPPGSLWVVGSTPVCQTVTTPPEAPAGEAAILTGAPSGLDQWCGAFARVLPDGAALLPGGIAGELLTVTQAAAQMQTAVTVVTQPDGQVTVYLSA